MTFALRNYLYSGIELHSSNMGYSVKNLTWHQRAVQGYAYNSTWKLALRAVGPARSLVWHRLRRGSHGSGRRHHARLLGGVGG